MIIDCDIIIKIIIIDWVIDVKRNILLTYARYGLILFFSNKIREFHLNLCLYIYMVLNEILAVS